MARFRHQQKPVTNSGPHQPRGLRRIVHPLGPLFRHLPLALRRHLLFLRHRGSWGNFRTPRGFGEKMQWRVINDRRPLLAWTADKLAQKEYAATVFAANNRLAAVRIPATLWAGTDVRTLRSLAAKLPSHWVFKPNHSCSRYRMIGASEAPHAMREPDWFELVQLGDTWGRRDEESSSLGHWAYNFARIGLMAEEWIGNGSRPIEAKVLCFGGRAHSILATDGVGTDDWRVSYYDANFSRVDSGWHDAAGVVEQVVAIEPSGTVRRTIIEAAEALAAPFDFVRVDLYVHEGVVWFGELTPYSGGGLMSVGAAYDAERGSHWKLPDLAAHDPREREWRALLEGPLRGTLQR